jgi:hypothetical protein
MLLLLRRLCKLQLTEIRTLTFKYAYAMAVYVPFLWLIMRKNKCAFTPLYLFFQFLFALVLLLVATLQLLKLMREQTLNFTLLEEKLALITKYSFFQSKSIFRCYYSITVGATEARLSRWCITSLLFVIIYLWSV